MQSAYGYTTASMILGKGFIPVPGNFDADQKTDLGVYQQATGNWDVILSASGYAVVAHAIFSEPESSPVWLRPAGF